MTDEQAADDVPDGAQLCVAGLDQSGADVVPEPEIAARGFGVARPRLGAALLVLGGGVAQLVIVDPGAGEVGLLSRRRRVAVAELLLDEVEHERGVDDPDPGGEVAPAVMDKGVAAVAGAAAHLAGDANLQRSRVCAGGERVELCVDALGRAAEDARDLVLAVRTEVLAGVRNLFCGVEHGAVVDPDRVGVLVLDDGAVHERSEVLERLLVQVGAGDPLCDRVGELRRDLVHVGEAVGHRDRDLLAGRALGDTRADRFRERELAAEVVGALGRDSEVGADRDDPVGLGQPGAGFPAVAQLLLLVDERQALALVGLGLDPADLVRARLVVEQQDDQALDRRQVFVSRCAGELVRSRWAASSRRCPS